MALTTIPLADTFRLVFDAFGKASPAGYKDWPALLGQFDVAFKTARKDRALETPFLNILDVFGLAARELCHSRIVEWFLKEDASHEQGSIFMECLLHRCGVPSATWINCTVQREKPSRVDIAAYKQRGFAVFIENKVRHHERAEQIADLQKELVKFSKAHQIPETHRIAVFLTDDGRPPTEHHKGPLAGFLPRNLYPIRRLDLFQEFQRSLAASAVKSKLLTSFLDAYVDAIASHH